MSLPGDHFVVVDEVPQEPACVLRLQRRGWPVKAVGQVLGVTEGQANRLIHQALADERRGF
ncbi:hypothetical protein [Rhodococcus jostii]|uniref:hypothetical protein n=1 Tax=Rhodococcus jostii TaxID=132919 RepID=UPI00363AB4D7